MKSKLTDKFLKAYRKLPEDVREQARQDYKLFQSDPNHPGLQFKKVHDNGPIYSVRIGLHYRALGVLKNDQIAWFWIGSHAEYDKMFAKF